MKTQLLTDHPRLAERVPHNHVTLLALTILGLVLADRFLCRATSPFVFRASMATGYVALLWLCIALSIGPLRKLRRLKIGANSYLRRDVGVWAAVLSCAHVTASLMISTTGMVELHAFFLTRSGDGYALRTDTLGWANHTGALATLLVLVLGWTSRDASIRRLGTGRWKGLQRTAYLAAAFTFIHCLLYQQMIERLTATLVAFWALTAALVALRIVALVRR